MENDIIRMLFLRRQRQKKRWRIKTISGAPPLSFKAKAGALKDYRIYGQTSRNLFDENSLISPISGFTWYFDDEHYLLATNTTSDNRGWRYSQSQFFIALSAGTYTLRLSGVGANSQYSEIYVFKSNGGVIYSENIAGKSNIVITFTLNTSDTIGIEIKLYNGKYRFMLNEGTVPLPYEPYGESVGDRTANLFDMSSAYAIGYIDDSGNIAIAQGYMITTYDFIPIDQNSSYSIKICGKLNDNTNQRKIRVAFYDRDQIFISRTGLGEASDVRTFNAINNSHYIRLSIDDGNTNIMLNEGSTALPYEPYGYKVPVTVSNGTDTQTIPIYLPEQIRKVGDEAELISYSEQKLHRIGADDIDVILPELPTLAGTNVLTVGTEVQPSGVEITGRIKKGE